MEMLCARWTAIYTASVKRSCRLFRPGAFRFSPAAAERSGAQRNGTGQSRSLIPSAPPQCRYLSTYDRRRARLVPVSTKGSRGGARDPAGTPRRPRGRRAGPGSHNHTVTDLLNRWQAERVCAPTDFPAARVIKMNNMDGCLF